MLTVGIINCIVLGVTGCAVIWYAWETKKLREISHDQTMLNMIENNINSLMISVGGGHAGEARKTCLGSIDGVDKHIEGLNEDLKLLQAPSPSKNNTDSIEKKQYTIWLFKELKEKRQMKQKIVTRIRQREN